MRQIAVASLVAGVALTGATPLSAITSPAVDDACALLSPADIARVTALKVGAGEAGKPIPGVLGRCTWTSAENARVIITLADERHIEITLMAQQGSGAKPVAGVGTKAVSWPATDITGGWIVTVEDAKGGFGVSVLGRSVTVDEPVALAKVVESRR